MSTVADPIEAFESKVKSLIASGVSEPKAVSRVVKANPELHRLYLIEANRRGGHKRAARRLAAQPSPER